MSDPVVTQGLLYIIGAVAAFVGVSTATITVFILNGNSKTRGVFYKELKSIRGYFNKVISLHNKEDDDRFETLNTEIWRLHLRNAKKDGTATPKFSPLPRRRYIDQQDGEIDDATD